MDMTADQIAIAQLETARIQTWITALAIFFGPLSGVVFTFWFQSRHDKGSEKNRLFLTLMCERKGVVPSPDVVKALNTIDVVFSDNPAVLALWHKYYALLSQPLCEDRTHTWLELLAAIAADLRYRNLKQTDLDKLYIPQGHVDQIAFQQEIQNEWLRVLKGTARLLVEPTTVA